MSFFWNGEKKNRLATCFSRFVINLILFLGLLCIIQGQKTLGKSSHGFKEEVKTNFFFLNFTQASKNRLQKMRQCPASKNRLQNPLLFFCRGQVFHPEFQSGLTYFIFSLAKLMITLFYPAVFSWAELSTVASGVVHTRSAASARSRLFYTTCVCTPFPCV